MISNIQNITGYAGGKVITDTTVYTPSTPARPAAIVAINALTTTVIAAAPGNMTGTAGMTLPAGAWLYGRFSSLQLTSGSVVAYVG